MKFKAIVFVRLRSSVSDSAGNAVRDCCNRMTDIISVNNLRLGKVLDIEFEAPDEQKAIEELEKLSDGFLANTVIEDWSYELKNEEHHP